MGAKWIRLGGTAALGIASGLGCSSPHEGAAMTTQASAKGCPMNSGYPADDMCLPAPAPDAGFQLHYGPSDYADPAKVAPYVLAPGKETVDCNYMKTSNAEGVYVSGYQLYMRPGSHHLVVNINPTAEPDGFGTCGAHDMSPGILPGTQTGRVDELEDPAPENRGLAVKLPARSQAVLNFHVVNSTAKPILREAWLNYFYIDASKVKGIVGNVFLTGGLGFYIQPGTSQTYAYSCSPDRPVRILALAAHMHAHATRLSAWKVAASQPTLVYENFDWSEPKTLKYDSVHTNPKSNRETRTAGGSSGMLVLQPGDALQWECAVDNTSNEILTFRNEVFTGEMCILAGAEVTVDDPMHPYDFSCTLK